MVQAVEAGRVDVTQKLIDFNAALVVHDINGSNTPLHVAVKIKVGGMLKLPQLMLWRDLFHCYDNVC